MGLQGDLSTLDLTSLFQNLEGARKTGLLTVRDEGEETQLFFEKGQLASISYPERPGLVDFLLAAGAVTEQGIEKARKKKRRGQALGSALVDAGVLSSEEISSVATARLVDEACEVLSAGHARFEFTEADRAPDAFDPDERALALALAASPLLLESARRSDHWAMIREHLPSDSTHYTVARPPRENGNDSKSRLVAEVAPLLDGSRSVREVVARFPARRFDVYQLLADLAKSQTIRPIPIADLNRRVLELARRDRKRALALLERALEQNPHHLELLKTKAMLAEKMGEKEHATEALKLVVHLQLEDGQKAEARATLKKLRELDPSDPFAWEKAFELSVEEGRRADAIADGRSLIEIYRKPGLHKKALAVLERLSKLQDPTWEIVRDLARARAEAGEREAAVKGLEKFAAGLIGLESYPLACRAYEEVLAIQPGRAKAKDTLHDLKTGAVAYRKAKGRRLRRRLLVSFLALVVLPWVSFEVLARRAYVQATRSIVREGLLEAGKFADAKERLVAVREHYSWTTAARYEIEPVIAELDARIAAGLKATP